MDDQEIQGDEKMRLSFTTVHDVPDDVAQEYINMLKYHGIPHLDPDILKNRTQVIEAEAEFFRPGESEKPIKIPLMTVIEAGTLQ